jgi:hypothetical protein
VRTVLALYLASPKRTDKSVTAFNDILRRLARQMITECPADQSDAQLIERALAGHDELAFEAMVHRHGAMVYRGTHFLRNVPQARKGLI